MEFKEHRNLFVKIKNDLLARKFSSNIVEFENAIQRLISDYNTANWENRFVVGGALEVLFCALLNSIGYKTKWLREKRHDIEINNVKYSIKSNFTGSGAIRLINILGNEEMDWNEATLFFISGLGICYADPEMNLSIQHTKDATLISVNQIKILVQNSPEWLIPLNIPHKPENRASNKIASYDVAKSILDEINSKLLKSHLPQQ